MGSAPWAAPPGQFAAPQRPASIHDIMMWTMLQQMHRMERDQEDGGDGSGGRAGAAFRKVHGLRKRVDRQPVAIINEYLEECRERLGAEPTDPWQLWHASNAIAWGRMLGLRRCHYHLSRVLTRMLAGQQVEAQAHAVQLLRAIHQAAADGGAWDTAAMLLPDEDPIRKPVHGVTERELEIITSYQEALKRLKRGAAAERDPPPDPQKGDGKGGKKPKKKKEGEGEEAG